MREWKGSAGERTIGEVDAALVQATVDEQGRAGGGRRVDRHDVERARGGGELAWENQRKQNN